MLVAASVVGQAAQQSASQPNTSETAAIKRKVDLYRAGQRLERIAAGLARENASLRQQVAALAQRPTEDDGDPADNHRVP